MPWLSIIMAIIGLLTSLMKNPEKKGQAVAAAALAGLGTYYVTHETEWGQDTLGALDGVVKLPDTPAPVDGGSSTITLPDGSTTGTTHTSVPSTINGQTSGIWDVLTNWGPTGTAAVIGTTAVATSSSWQKYLPWILIGGAVLLLTR